MRLADHIAAWQKELKPPTKIQQSEGVYRLLVDQQWLLCLEAIEEEGCFFLFSSVCEIPKQGEVEALRSALSGNLFGKETGDAVLALHLDTDLLILFRRFEEATLRHEELMQGVQEFISLLRHWKEKIQRKSLKESVALQTHFQNYEQPDAMKIFFA